MKKSVLILLLLVFLSAIAFAANMDIDGVNYSPTPANPGEYISLWVHVKNNSSQIAKNVVFIIDLEKSTGQGTYPFSLDSGEPATKSVGNINPYQSAVVEYSIIVDELALNGNYIIKLKVGDDGKVSKEQAYTITVLARKPVVEIVESSIDEAKPGEKIGVDITLKNVGRDEALDLLVGLEEERTVTTTGVVVERDITALGASFNYVGKLGVGEEKSARIVLGINPNASLKTYMVPIKLKYKDSNANDYSVTRYLGLMVKEDAELGSVISEIAPAAYPGGTSEISVDLFNVGTGTAQYVVAELSADFGQVETPKTFIGTLDPDDFDSFKTKIKINGDLKPGQHSIKLTLSYKNHYGEARNAEISLPFKVGSIGEASAASQPIDIWFIVVVLIVLFFMGRWAYRKIRKKK